MPLTDSRLGPGTLSLGPSGTSVDFSAQTAAVRLTPSTDSTDGTPTLETPEPAPLTTVSWALNVDAIQDFDDPLGFVNYLMDNALAEQEFAWVPNTDGGTSYAGIVQIIPIEIGGDVAVQVVTSVELPLVGEPTRTDPIGTSTRSSSRSSKEAAA
jgi:hypothetical protein